MSSMGGHSVNYQKTTSFDQIVMGKKGHVTQATLAPGTVVMNNSAGIISITSALTLAADAEIVLTLTNSTITVDSMVMVSVNEYGGDSFFNVSADNVAVGTCSIVVSNAGGAASTAVPLKINVLVL
jgi:1-deoxy-D-xylulose 5-phosphate reductoisomerase